MAERLSDKEQLERLLDALADFLDANPPGSHGPDQTNYFAQQVRASADEVRRGDAHGLRRFLGLHGGMGSLNDTYYQPVNRNAASEREAEELQARFEELDPPAWRLASELLREFERSP